MTVKQIIVIRKDLKNIHGQKIRSGKICTQAAHASLGVILDMLCPIGENLHLHCSPDSYLDEWINNSYPKISLAVNSLDELMDIKIKLDIADIRNKIIIDNGTTEFGGIKTYTCLASEPYDADVLDKITGQLSLF